MINKSYINVYFERHKLLHLKSNRIDKNIISNINYSQSMHIAREKVFN